jgi:hygromycin-B 4-O-kinase
VPQTVSTVEIQQFLGSVFNPFTEQVCWIASGWFSQAFSFTAQEKTFIIRLNPYEEDFLKDGFAANHYACPGLPVPRIVQLGQFDRRYFYAITERCKGQALEDFDEKVQRQMIPAIFDTLDRVHCADISKAEGWGLTNSEGQGMFRSWSEYLLTLFNQKFIFDWHALAHNTFLEEAIFEAAYAAMQALIPFCNQEKSLLHGDFGPHNLVSDGRVITGVLDWADARLGDYLYDVAYLDYWSEEIPYAGLWRHHAIDQRQPESYFDERIRCYQLHNVLNDMAVSAIQGNRLAYNEAKQRLHVLMK